MREGRRVTIENVPDPHAIRLGVLSTIYQRLHSFNVYGLAFPHHQTPKPWLSRYLAILDFETADEAQRACDLYDNTKRKDRLIRVNISQPPMKHPGVSSGRPGGHFAARDLGSAKGTNFEKARVILSSTTPVSPRIDLDVDILLTLNMYSEEEILRKQVLGSRDRGWWVAGQ